MKDIRTIVKDNLIAIRKQNNLTQLDLAKKVNYSDNAISRWENGEVVPSLETLQLLSYVYNVPVTWFLEEHSTEEKKRFNKRERTLHVAIMLSMFLIVWTVSAITFLLLKKYTGKYYVMAFVWAIPATCLCLLITQRHLLKKGFCLLTKSLLLWTIIGCAFFQLFKYKLWHLFLLGIPIQIMLTLFAVIRSLKEDDDFFKRLLTSRKKSKKEKAAKK